MRHRRESRRFGRERDVFRERKARELPGAACESLFVGRSASGSELSGVSMA